MPGLLEQLGLNIDPEAMARENLQQRQALSLGLVNKMGFSNPADQGGANIGALLGARMGGAAPLTTHQQQALSIKNEATSQFNEWVGQNQDVPDDEKSLKYQELMARSAIKNGRSDIGAELFKAGAEQRQLKKKQDKELELLGFQTRAAQSRAEELERGDLKTVWKVGERNPDNSFTGTPDPTTGNIITDTGETLTPAQYTLEKPLDPRRGISTTNGGAGAGGPQLDLTPEAVHDGAIATFLDPSRIRQYASFGTGGQVARTKINNEMALMRNQAGISNAQVAALQARAKGQTKSIGQLIEMQNAVGAYEVVARGNGQRFVELTKEVNKSGVPLINSALRLKDLALGDPNAAEMLQVLQNYQTEAARIVSNPRLVGQLTDTARQEIKDVIPGNLTPKQAERIIKRLEFEFDLRAAGIDDARQKAEANGFGWLQKFEGYGSGPAPTYPTDTTLSPTAVIPTDPNSPASPAAASVPSPKTQAEYDALDSGTIYIDTDGKQKRKK